jgi:hypothetical protein
MIKKPNNLNSQYKKKLKCLNKKKVFQLTITMTKAMTNNNNVFDTKTDVSRYRNKHVIHRSEITQYKIKYPTTFAELKLDGFTDIDAVRYIRNNYEYEINNNMKYDSYIPGSSTMTFMNTLEY